MRVQKYVLYFLSFSRLFPKVSSIADSIRENSYQANNVYFSGARIRFGLLHCFFWNATVYFRRPVANKANSFPSTFRQFVQQHQGCCWTNRRCAWCAVVWRKGSCWRICFLTFYEFGAESPLGHRVRAIWVWSLMRRSIFEYMGVQLVAEIDFRIHTKIQEWISKRNRRRRHTYV